LTVNTISPLLWIDGERRDRVDPDVRPDTLYGHFGVATSDGKRHLLARDPMGVHKLFFALDDNGGIDTDVWLHALLKRRPASRVFSAPSSALLEIDAEARKLTHKPYPELPFDAASSEAEAAEGISRALDLAFQRIAQAIGGAPVHLTLSGGLDSSTIATFAATHLPRKQLAAVTLHVDDGKPVTEGTDLHAARAVAERLELPLHEIVVKPESIPELLDDVLLFGQDFRDFNVHCALVNAAIGRELGSRNARLPGYVLTGDGANELMSDYEAVDLEGRSYYELPKLSRSMLRRFLIRGLDAGDREVGVFARFGLACIQPFLLAARAFAMVPGTLIDDRTAKSQLARRVLGDRIPKLIFERPKVRAQCGRQGEPSGTMATLIRAGIDQDALLQRFMTLYGMDTAFARGLIRAGMYRTPQRFEQLV
jgi:asparagine synthetase B (glutamine-hydrolysing)